MTPDSASYPNTLARRALGVAVLATAGCVIAGALDLDQFLRAYLVAWIYWLSITLGCFAMLLLHNLTGGDWGYAVRPWARAGAATLPLMALGFIPVALAVSVTPELLGTRPLYAWADPEIVAHDHVLQHKQPYLNPPFFYARAAFYFIGWVAFWLVTQAWFRRVLRTGDLDLARRLRLVSGLGLLFYGLTITFASVDWLMSLEPHWFSTIYGVMIFVGQCLAGLAFVIAATCYFPHAGWNMSMPAMKPLHDLGKLLLGFVMLWAYMAFIQFLIIWYGNLPEEVPWYLRRTENGWQWIAGAIVLFHFFLPFSLLLSRRAKRHATTLLRIAALLVVMRWVDVWWLIQPAMQEGLFFPWRELLATFALGGLWLATFAWNVPERDELSREAIQQQKALAS